MDQAKTVDNNPTNNKANANAAAGGSEDEKMPNFGNADYSDEDDDMKEIVVSRAKRIIIRSTDDGMDDSEEEDEKEEDDTDDEDDDCKDTRRVSKFIVNEEEATSRARVKRAKEDNSESEDEKLEFYADRYADMDELKKQAEKQIRILPEAEQRLTKLRELQNSAQADSTQIAELFLSRLNKEQSCPDEKKKKIKHVATKADINQALTLPADNPLAKLAQAHALATGFRAFLNGLFRDSKKSANAEAASSIRDMALEDITLSNEFTRVARDWANFALSKNATKSVKEAFAFGRARVEARQAFVRESELYLDVKRAPSDSRSPSDRSVGDEAVRILSGLYYLLDHFEWIRWSLGEKLSCRLKLLRGHAEGVQPDEDLVSVAQACGESHERDPSMTLTAIRNRFSVTRSRLYEVNAAAWQEKMTSGAIELLGKFGIDASLLTREFVQRTLRRLDKLWTFVCNMTVFMNVPKLVNSDNDRKVMLEMWNRLEGVLDTKENIIRISGNAKELATLTETPLRFNFLVASMQLAQEKRDNEREQDVKHAAEECANGADRRMAAIDPFLDEAKRDAMKQRRTLDRRVRDHAASGALSDDDMASANYAKQAVARAERARAREKGYQENDYNRTCEVCGDYEWTDDNPILICEAIAGGVGSFDTCDRYYHQACVGLDEVPEGSWVGPCCDGSGAKFGNMARKLEASELILENFRLAQLQRVRDHELAEHVIRKLWSRRLKRQHAASYASMASRSVLCQPSAKRAKM
jgi:hypothetical protein